MHFKAKHEIPFLKKIYSFGTLKYELATAPLASRNSVFDWFVKADI